MDPIKFVGYNEVYAENQSEYMSLPVYKEPNGQVTSVWEPTEEERKNIADGAMICLRVNTFNSPLQPLQLWIDKDARKIGVNYSEDELYNLSRFRQMNSGNSTIGTRKNAFDDLHLDFKIMDGVRNERKLVLKTDEQLKELIQ